MANTVTNPGSRLAGLIADLCQKVKHGSISEDDLAQWLKERKVKGGYQVKVVAAPTTFLTASYFVDRRGIRVVSGFISRIVSAYPEKLVPRGLKGVESFDLPCPSNKKILDRPEMGGEENVRKHAFMPDQIAALINRDLKGRAGKLLTNGSPNLFYVVGKNVALFMVRLSWDRIYHRWRVSAWTLDELLDPVDCRVFYNTRSTS